MTEWTAIWGNNPDDDYNLIREINYNDKEVAVVKQSQQGLILKWYVSPKGLVMPVDWFSKLLLDAKEGIVDPVTVIEEFVMSRWTADWTNDPDDDYNLTLEILCDDEHVAVIKRSHESLVLKWYSGPKGLIMPVDWLSGLLLSAKEGINNRLQEKLNNSQM